MPDPTAPAPDVLEALNGFDPEERREAVDEIAAALKSGALARPATGDWVNCHAHTFFSYNSLNLSPSGLVWEALRQGLWAIASTDFDVLDAMDEMLRAGDALAVRTAVSLETRAYAADYADRELNSPGEPGVVYAMGVGFVRRPFPDSAAGKVFASLAERSRRRNEDMVAKVNDALDPVRLDYAQDVLPLTPSGNATERHLCQAYDVAAAARYADPDDLAGFWADRLGLGRDAVDTLLADRGALRNTIRAKLMKQGGVGYVKPDRDSFPKVEDFFAMAAAAGAVPCYAWLDGTTSGERDPGALLDDAIRWGARSVNIIPDRNWNIADPAAKQTKLAALAAFVKAARERDLPIIAGTELNGPGQKFVDSFDTPELAPYVDDFRTGAAWLYGHTFLERADTMGASSEWAQIHFGGDRAASNRFYAEVGRRVRPGAPLPHIDRTAKPDAVLDLVR